MGTDEEQIEFAAGASLSRERPENCIYTDYGLTCELIRLTHEDREERDLWALINWNGVSNP